jgi:hypothetical protein
MLMPQCRQCPTRPDAPVPPVPDAPAAAAPPLPDAVAPPALAPPPVKDIPCADLDGCKSAIPRVSSTCGAPGGDISVAGSSIPPCPRSIPTPNMPKMTTGTRRIPAVPGSQRPRTDLVEARVSNPRRILLRQPTLSVCPFHAFPFPWKGFPRKHSLSSFPWKVFPGKFSLESFPWKVFPGNFFL